ncbi:MAG: hypothetical protein ACXVCP_11385 [Bdellovibrio sp.]
MKTAIAPNNNQHYEILERLKTVAGFTNENWHDLLEMSWKDYTKLRTHLLPIPERAVITLANHFQLKPESFLLEKLDFQKIQIDSEKRKWSLPEQYSIAAYGKARTTIAFFDYLEKIHGWQIRYETIKHLGISESMLVNSFDPISMRVGTDTMEYLSRRKFRTKDFFSMGIFANIENSNSELGRFFKQLKSTRNIIENIIEDSLKYYEANCSYKLLALKENSAIVTVNSKRQVADEMGLNHLGNEQICWAKAGWFASMPIYLGLPFLKVVKTHCEHRGDSACRYEVHFDSPSITIN